MSVTRLALHIGDITALAVDVIVNAANERMLGGGGVDGAIHRAAGPELLSACRAVAEVRRGVRCPTGQARITPAFNLPARYVVHTVGPVWQGGECGEPELLASCYREAFRLAVRHGARSMSFPAISCGVYGFPHETAGQIAVAVLRAELDACQEFERVHLVAFGEPITSSLRAALEAAA